MAVPARSTFMGPPMGGNLGPAPGVPVQMPNFGAPPMQMGMQPPPMQMGMAPPMAPPQMAPPPVAGVPQAAQAAAPLSTQVSGYGGSASGRAKFKGALRTRKASFLDQQAKVSVPHPTIPPNFGKLPNPNQVPMSPVRPMVNQPTARSSGVASLGRIIDDNSNVGREPVRLMNGGVVPLFNGLGRY